MKQDDTHNGSPRSVLIESSSSSSPAKIKIFGRNNVDGYVTFFYENTSGVRLQRRVWLPAPVDVTQFLDVFRGLSSMCDSLFDDKKKPSSLITWGSTDGELELSATINPLGNIELTVEFCQNDTIPYWSATVILSLCCGEQLKVINKELHEFFNNVEEEDWLQDDDL